MSTLQTINLKNPSSAASNMIMDANGSVTIANNLTVSGGLVANGVTITAGSNTTVIFNDSGVTAGNSNFTFDKTTLKLTVGNSTINTVISTTGITFNDNTAGRGAIGLTWDESSVGAITALTRGWAAP